MGSDDQNPFEGMPFFGDLPYLGRLFKRTQNQSNKQELLVFVTPKILNEAVSLSAR